LEKVILFPCYCQGKIILVGNLSNKEREAMKGKPRVDRLIPNISISVGYLAGKINKKTYSFAFSLTIIIFEIYGKIYGKTLTKPLYLLYL